LISGRSKEDFILSKMMNGILLDSCILLDLFIDDAKWADWSESILGKYSQTNTMY
jgi:hypothetical protein